MAGGSQFQAPSGHQPDGPGRHMPSGLTLAYHVVATPYRQQWPAASQPTAGHKPERSVSSDPLRT